MVYVYCVFHVKRCRSVRPAITRAVNNTYGRSDIDCVGEVEVRQWPQAPLFQSAVVLGEWEGWLGGTW
jgi:hypothetical protein